MFNILVDFKDLDHILESSLDVQSFLDIVYVVYQLSEIKDDIQVVSQFPCLFGTPFSFENNHVFYQDELYFVTVRDLPPSTELVIFLLL